MASEGSPAGPELVVADEYIVSCAGADQVEMVE